LRNRQINIYIKLINTATVYRVISQRELLTAHHPASTSQPAKPTSGKCSMVWRQWFIRRR